MASAIKQCANSVRNGIRNAVKMQVYGSFLLNALAKSDIFCRDENAIDLDMVVVLVEHVISVLETGVGFEELERACFSNRGKMYL